MTDMLQTFMRMANLYNPQQMGSDMPSELPLQTRPPQIPTHLPYDESVTAPVEEEPQSTLEAFRQSVLNPPKRTHMTYPKNTLAGLTEALKIAAEPTPTQQNRVYVNNQPYQKAKVYTDPTTGEKKFITAHDPSFMTQVMRAMPAAVSPAVDILNQPYADAVSDWEMRNKGLSAAANAESQMALASQRYANAGAIPERLRQGNRALDIKQMDAETRARLASLKDLSDSEKVQLLQEGRISLEELRASNQYTLQELRGEQRTGQIEQQGQIRSGQIAQQGNIRSGQIAQQGQIQKEVAGVRGEEARKTKGTPSANAGVTSQLPTQQIKAYQIKANQLVQDHPEYKDYITIDDNGMVQVEPPTERWYGHSGPTKEEYDQIVSYLRGGTTAAPVNQPPAKPQTTAPSTKAPGSSKMPPPKVKAAPGSTSMIPMTTPDGKSVRMVPENQVQVALGQGYKYKTASK